MAGSKDTFSPAYGSGTIIAVSTSSANGEVDASRSRSAVCVSNIGSEAAYIRTGDSTVVATTADYLLLSGTQVTISKKKTDTHLAAITASGASSVHIIAGAGV